MKYLCLSISSGLGCAKKPLFSACHTDKITHSNRQLSACSIMVKMSHLCLANKLRIFTVRISSSKLLVLGGFLKLSQVLVPVVAESSWENMTGICESTQARRQEERNSKL